MTCAFTLAILIALENVLRSREVLPHVKTISEKSWIGIQGNLFPQQITVSLCDCDLDLLDVSFRPSQGFDVNDIPQDNWGLQNADGILPYGSALMWLGMLLGIVASTTELRRYQKAQGLAQSFHLTRENQWT